MESDAAFDSKQAKMHRKTPQPLVDVEDDKHCPHHVGGHGILANDFGPDPSLIEDLPNMVLLVVLYMMQGVPLGLTMGALPLLLASKASYTQVCLHACLTDD
jgi:hypothetical protein